jgi:hypothetical protein
MQQAVKSWKVKEWKAMGLNAFIVAQLYKHNRQQCNDSLLEKRDLSVSTTRAIRTRDRGAKKFGSLKDFEVCGVLKKEPRFNEQG